MAVTLIAASARARELWKSEESSSRVSWPSEGTKPVTRARSQTSVRFGAANEALQFSLGDEMLRTVMRVEI